MSWRMASLLIVLTYGFGMYFVARSNPIHGGKVGCFLQMAGYALLLMALGFGKSDLARITGSSLAWGASGALLLVVGTYIMFQVYADNPAKAGVVSALSESWPLITVLLLHFTRTPMTGRQWLCALVATSGIVGLVFNSPQK